MNWYKEITKGKRYKFGNNWKEFIEKNLNDISINQAIISTKKVLEESQIDLKNKTVIDIGSGSGLFSLVALELGAKFVLSFDYDPDSVNCTKKLLSIRKFDNRRYKCLEGSILNDSFISTLGQFDLVYSWGVLHHTGKIYKALENSSKLVKKDGLIFISLYQKTILDFFWVIEKKIFNLSSKLVQLYIFKTYIFIIKLAYFLKGKSLKKVIKNYSSNRGMNFYNDAYDWLGGYPYQGIDTKECIKFYSNLGFENILLKKRSKFFSFSSGCNEFIFKKN
tara:strand:- start:6950 stop:7783 length:834 start_codon:yes stop_codon:yes gene_type:complete